MEIVSDAKVVVGWINSGGVGSMNHVDIIYDIRESLQKQGSVAVVFAGRATNYFADSLAKRGAHREGDFVEWS